MKVINLFAGPGAGKSTTAAALFAEMKRKGIVVELVTEYAKDLTWEERFNLLNEDQLYILAKQNRRLYRLLDKKVEYAVSDSPLLMGLIYKPENSLPHLEGMIWDVWNSYENINVYLDRKDRPYSKIGRTQTVDEAKEIDKKIFSMLYQNKIDSLVVDSEGSPERKIIETLKI